MIREEKLTAEIDQRLDELSQLQKLLLTSEPEAIIGHVATPRTTGKTSESGTDNEPITHPTPRPTQHDREAVRQAWLDYQREDVSDRERSLGQYARQEEESESETGETDEGPDERTHLLHCLRHCYADIFLSLRFNCAECCA